MAEEPCFSSKSELAIFLSRLKGFASPNIRLEQYETPSEIASTLVWHAFMEGNIKGKIILDLGAGTGILSLAAMLLGAKKVIAIEIDSNALKIFKENIDFVASQFGNDFVNPLEVINADIKACSNNLKDIDTIVMNPPFGTKDRGKDTEFLRIAFSISPLIYSIHKSSTLPFLRSFSKKYGYEMYEISREILKIKAMHSFHTRQLYPVEVSLLKFEKS